MLCAQIVVVEAKGLAARREKEMTYATLNIGLSVGEETAKQGQLFKTLRMVRLAAGDVEITSRLAKSSTEWTLVVVLEEPLAEDALYLLAETLEQDCVAQLTSDGVGTLVGPRPWGEFDLNQFIAHGQGAH